jgi:catechol 2,3-dioxygenase-like lactoylglutathione lyase family enzyme
MITGAHVTIFTPKAEAVRMFLRDKLGLPSTDVGGGWLIFDLPRTELGVHPSEGGTLPPERQGTVFQELSFICADIHATVAELKGKGIEISSEVTDEGYGHVARFKLPGVGEAMLYEPRYGKPAS